MDFEGVSRPTAVGLPASVSADECVHCDKPLQVRTLLFQFGLFRYRFVNAGVKYCLFLALHHHHVGFKA